MPRQELEILLRLRDQVSSNLRGIEGAVTRFQGAASRAFSDFKRSFDLGIGATLGFQAVQKIQQGLSALTTGAVAMASNFEEAANKVSVVFGSAADSVFAFADTAVKSAGLSKAAALEITGTFGNMLTSMGFAEEQAAEMSITMTKLGADIASFANIPIGDALEKLRAGLAGEQEPLRAIGAGFTAAEVAAKALALGLAETSAEITEQDKVMARYQLILEKTSNAQGDFVNTSGSLANQQRQLSAAFENLQISIGQALLPVMTVLTTVAQEVTSVLSGMGSTASSVIVGVTALGAALTGLLAFLPQIVAGARLAAAGFAAMHASMLGPIGLAAALGAALGGLIVKLDLLGLRSNDNAKKLEDFGQELRDQEGIVQKLSALHGQAAATVEVYGKSYTLSGEEVAKFTELLRQGVDAEEAFRQAVIQSREAKTADAAATQAMADAQALAKDAVRELGLETAATATDIQNMSATALAGAIALQELQIEALKASDNSRLMRNFIMELEGGLDILITKAARTGEEERILAERTDYWRERLGLVVPVLKTASGAVDTATRSLEDMREATARLADTIVSKFQSALDAMVDNIIRGKVLKAFQELFEMFASRLPEGVQKTIESMIVAGATGDELATAYNSVLDILGLTAEEAEAAGISMGNFAAAAANAGSGSGPAVQGITSITTAFGEFIVVADKAAEVMAEFGKATASAVAASAQAGAAMGFEQPLTIRQRDTTGFLTIDLVPIRAAVRGRTVAEARAILAGMGYTDAQIASIMPHLTDVLAGAGGQAINPDVQARTSNNQIGTSWFKGGATTLSEGGPETVILPKGTQIIPAGETSRMMQQREAGPLINLTLHIDRPLGKPREIAQAVMEAIIELQKTGRMARVTV